MYPHTHAAVAGTFDRLHIGHKSLLTKAFTVAHYVSVGITAQDMVMEKHLSDIILPYDQRLADVKKFIVGNGWVDRAKFFELHDMYGPALSDQTIDALVVSSKTEDGAHQVNQKRQACGLTKLSIVVAEYCESEDHSYLSSTRIRMGEIDRAGHAYQQFLLKHAPLKLPVEQRDYLKSPLGDLVPGDEQDLLIAVNHVATNAVIPYKTCCVGDVVSFSFLQAKLRPNVVVVDNKNRRNIATHAFVPNDEFETTTTENPAAIISQSAIEAVSRIVKRIKETDILQQLIVHGEEDLLVLPLILLLPLQSSIYYGQPGQGIVRVTVTEQKKQEILTYVKKWIIDVS